MFFGLVAMALKLLMYWHFFSTFTRSEVRMKARETNSFLCVNKVGCVYDLNIDSNRFSEECLAAKL